MVESVQLPGEQGAARMRSNPRLGAILDLVNPDLPVWDLCCDHGHIGCSALKRRDTVQVVFVDRAVATADRLERRLGRDPRFAGRYRIVCADVLEMALPPPPVNFVVAGVSTNVIVAFLDRMGERGGDRIICNTFQEPARFEAAALTRGFAVVTDVDVATRGGRTQRVWLLRPHPQLSGPDRANLL